MYKKAVCRTKMLSSLVLYSRKLFLMPLLLLSKSGWGNSTLSYFVESIRFSHGIALTITSWYRVDHHKIDLFVLSRYSCTFVCHCFQLKLNQNVNSKLNSFYPWEDFKLSSLWFGLQNFFGFNTKNPKCAWQKYQRRTCLNYYRLYIFKICALWHATLVVKINAMPCFLNGFGIAVLGSI